MANIFGKAAVGGAKFAKKKENLEAKTLTYVISIIFVCYLLHNNNDLLSILFLSRQSLAALRVGGLLTPPATAERSVAAALRIWFTRRDFFILFYFFLCLIFSESSEPIGLKFGRNA